MFGYKLFHKNLQVVSSIFAGALVPTVFSFYTPSTLMASVSSIKGNATYYADYYQGSPTASGELYDSSDYTAASCDYPIGTYVKVINLRNDETTIVRINDTGGFCGSSTVIDLSREAMSQLKGITDGVIPVIVEPVN